MWRGIKLLSCWRHDQVHSARFQSSAAFTPGKTVASCCGTAVEVHCVSAEPGYAVKSQGIGMARSAVRPEQHSPSNPTQGNTCGPMPLPTQKNPETRCFAVKRVDLWWFHWNSSMHPNLGRAAGNAMPKWPLPHEPICKNSEALP